MRNFHVVIDPTVAPGVSTPELDGITEEDAIKLNKLILNHINDIVSYDLVEFNPLKDENRKTEQLALNLLAQVLRAAENKSKITKKF